MIAGGFFLVLLLLLSFWGINFLALNLMRALDSDTGRVVEPVRFDLDGFRALNLLPGPVEPTQE